MVVWSAKGAKGTPGVAADELMILDSEDAIDATKNKRMSYQNLADSLLDLSSISGLTDGESTILSTSLVAFEQGGSKFKASMRPNPSSQRNITSQAQLEAEFGTNLEMPDDESVTIQVDDSFTLTKPFKLGLNSSLRVFGSVLDVAITYTGPGAIFQNTNPANAFTTLDVAEILLIGDNTNDVFDIVGSLFLGLNRVRFQNFNSIGTIEVPGIVINSITLFNVSIGFVFINPVDFIINSAALVNFSPLEITLFSVISNVAGSVTFSNIVSSGIFAGSWNTPLSNPGRVAI